MTREPRSIEPHTRRAATASGHTEEVIVTETTATEPKKSPALTKSRGGAAGDKVFSNTALAAGVIILLVLAFVAIFLVVEALPALWPEVFSTHDSIESADTFWQYVWPLMAGTIIASVIALLLATPPPPLMRFLHALLACVSQAHTSTASASLAASRYACSMVTA